MTVSENQVPEQGLEEGENPRVWKARARDGLGLLNLEGWAEPGQEERKEKWCQQRQEGRHWGQQRERVLL